MNTAARGYLLLASLPVFQHQAFQAGVAATAHHSGAEPDRDTRGGA